MPFYTFQDKAGKEYDVLIASADQAVAKYPINEFVQLPGPDAPILKRIYTTGVARDPSTQGNMEIHCMQIPKWLPEAPRHDEMGRAVLLSNKEKDEFAAKIGAVEGQGIEKDHWNED